MEVNNKINAKENIVNLSNSILKYFKIKPYHDTLHDLDKLLNDNNYQNIVMFICDGLGNSTLNNNLDINSFLRKNKFKKINTVFPPTTTAATTSILTGLYPSCHNWYGWDVYFKDTDETISLYLNKLKDTKEEPKVNVLERKHMNYKTLVDLINEQAEFKAYYAYPFDKKYPCKNIDEVINRITKICSRRDNFKRFIYAYIENPDKLMHQDGINSKKVFEEVNHINDKIKELASNLNNTLIIVTADHGLINTTYINLKKDLPEIYNMLKRTTSIETRACGIKLKENIKKDDFINLYNKYLKKDFLILSLDDVKESSLFGPKQNDYLFDAIGDYLLVATGNISIIYDDNSLIFKANHAGFTEEELEVPLILIDCNKDY